MTIIIWDFVHDALKTIFSLKDNVIGRGYPAIDEIITTGAHHAHIMYKHSL